MMLVHAETLLLVLTCATCVLTLHVCPLLLLLGFVHGVVGRCTLSGAPIPD
jgi:hypothetical protein